MCKFKEFYYLCGCSKYSIAKPCESTSVNATGEAFCPRDPHAHPEDGRFRGYDMPTLYGPGVCESVTCQWHFGVLAPGDFGDTGRERDDGDANAVFDMSEEVRKEREDRWYPLLSTDQQLECLSITFPLLCHELSDYARVFLNPYIDQDSEALFRAAYAKVKQVRWQELNPRYLGARELQQATGLFLPASVTAPGQERGSTPHLPTEGPSKVGEHKCRPKVGVCRKSGRNRGKKAMPAREVPKERELRNLGLAIGYIGQQFEEGGDDWEEVMTSGANRGDGMGAEDAGVAGRDDVGVGVTGGNVLGAEGAGDDMEIDWEADFDVTVMAAMRDA